MPEQLQYQRKLNDQKAADRKKAEEQQQAEGKGTSNKKEFKILPPDQVAKLPPL